jgi:hypothetical protein
MKDKTYRIYSRWLALALRKKGFKIVNTDINEYHPEYTVWIFENSPELQAAITQLSNTHKRG